jgi:hypothetical protein
MGFNRTVARLAALSATARVRVQRKEQRSEHILLELATQALECMQVQAVFKVAIATAIS